MHPVHQCMHPWYMGHTYHYTHPRISLYDECDVGAHGPGNICDTNTNRKKFQFTYYFHPLQKILSKLKRLEDAIKYTIPRAKRGRGYFNGYSHIELVDFVHRFRISVPGWCLKISKWRMFEQFQGSIAWYRLSNQEELPCHEQRLATTFTDCHRDFLYLR